MHPHLLPAKTAQARMGCSLCMIAEQHQKLQYISKRALWLVLVYEEEHDCADGADSERIITSEKSIKKHVRRRTMNSVTLALSFSGHSPWRRVREAHAGFWCDI